jgi:hypothetical protein
VVEAVYPSWLVISPLTERAYVDFGGQFLSKLATITTFTLNAAMLALGKMPTFDLAVDALDRICR